MDEYNGGIYLYWQSSTKLEKSYKVSIRLTDSSGEERFQMDNIPQMWTHPTTSWTADETIIDFYFWELDAPCPDCDIQLIVYDEATLEPVLATTKDDETMGPIIPLGK